MLRAKSICPLFVLFAAVLLAACSDSTGPELTQTDSWQSVASPKVIVDSPSPLAGRYEGQYQYSIRSGTSIVVEQYRISWRFSGKNYWMTSEDSYSLLCEPWGQYVLSDDIEFVEKDDGSPCAVPEKNPTGAFSIRQSQDSLIMTQVSGDIQKVILLVPADSDTPDL